MSYSHISGTEDDEDDAWIIPTSSFFAVAAVGTIVTVLVLAYITRVK